MQCRGAKCREELAKKYTIIPRSHTKLLNGQEKRSCTGKLLTDSYYLFEYINKSDPNDTGGFYCGSHAAAHFLKLINSPGLSEFNPLKSPPISSNKGAQNNQGQGGNQAKQWNQTALELYNAINLLIICWDKPIYGRLAKIKEELVQFCDKEPFDWKVQYVNNIIGKDGKKRSLSTMVHDLRIKNPDIKNFTFENLNEVLKKQKIDSNF